MKPAKVLSKEPGQVTDFAGGNANTIVVDQHGANRFALLVLKKTLEPNKNHHIVADRSIRKQVAGQ